MKIITNHVHPPIPDRSCDWSAVTDNYDGAEDSHSPIGRGPTEVAAVRDLLDELYPDETTEETAELEYITRALEGMTDGFHELMDVNRDLRSKITWRDERIAEYLARIAELESALDHAEAVMSIVEPRSDKAEYLATLGEIRAALNFVPPESRPSFDGPIVGVRNPDVTFVTFDEVASLARELNGGEL